uniref:DHC_N1 domain-containing protein n=1 Tax=Heterorhabditis bacteriophora TaxID=37862 RepID=A0A1I7WK45_HETBA
MRKFLSIPEKFKGVQEGDQVSKFFSPMLERNAMRFSSLYVKAEELLKRVEKVDSQFPWLVLAQVDLEELIEEKFNKASDWESQMKLLKTKGREAEKLPNEIRFECIIVNTTGAKSAIDELLQRLFDTLTWTLRLNITTKLQSIQQFLTQVCCHLHKNNFAILSSKLLISVARYCDVGNFRKSKKRLNVVSSGRCTITTDSSLILSIFVVIMQLLRSHQYENKIFWKHYYLHYHFTLQTMWSLLEDQHTLLRSVAGSGVEQMTSIGRQWERFEASIFLQYE